MDKLREPGNALHTYKSLYLLCNIFNGICGNFYVPFLSLAIMITSTVCNSILIRYYYILGSSGVVAVSGVAMAAAMYPLVISFKIAKIYEVSNSFKSSWRRSQGIKLRVFDQRLMMKYLKSCRPMRIQIGSYDYYRNSSSTTICTKVIFFTGKLLLFIS